MRVLEDLYAALEPESAPDPMQHGAAITVLQEEAARIKTSPTKHRRRSQPPQHSLRAEMAMDVWAARIGGGLSDAEAIRRVVLARDALANPEKPGRPLSRLAFEARENRIHNLRKKVEAAYYALKPHLPEDESELGQRWFPLEEQLDE